MQNKMRSAKTFKKPAPIVPPSTSANNSTDSENAMQFELELTWCINTLEQALNTGKISEKVAEHTLKNIKILKSNSTPLIKKRQVMKAACGDYRKIMKDEEKKLGLASRQIKFTSTTDPNKKSSFVKKSAILSSGKDFRFNFNPPATDEENAKVGDEKDDTNAIINSRPNVLAFTLGTTRNEFKFNFDIQEEGDINIQGLSIKN